MNGLVKGVYIQLGQTNAMVSNVRNMLDKGDNRKDIIAYIDKFNYEHRDGQ